MDVVLPDSASLRVGTGATSDPWEWREHHGEGPAQPWAAGPELAEAWPWRRDLRFDWRNLVVFELDGAVGAINEDDRPVLFLGSFKTHRNPPARCNRLVTAVLTQQHRGPKLPLPARGI